MRTTLDIASDVLLAARELARREKKTMGEIISALARNALTATPAARAAREPKAVYGMRPFPGRGGLVTNELIDNLREDDVY
jgi:hypothetical protein